MPHTPRGAGIGNNLSIVKKGLLLVAIPLLAQLIFLAFLVKIRQEQQEAQHWAIHSKEVIAQAETAYRVLWEARTSVRSLALTGDPKFIKAWDRSRRDSFVRLDDLRKLVNDNRSQQVKIEQIGAFAEDALVRLKKIEQLAEQRATRERALEELRTPWALRFLDELREGIDDFLHEEERLNAERQQRLEYTRREQDWILFGGGVLAVLSTLGLVLAFSRGISSRLAVLSDNVRRLTRGESLAAPLSGHDELGQLDRVFHDMAESLAQKSRDNEMFVYSVSHDLRSPLVNLQGFSQELALVCADLRRAATENDLAPALRERMVGLIDRDAAESVQFIQIAVRRLASIIDALLRLSRVGRVEYQWQQVDVRAAVDRVIQASAKTIAEKKARLVVGDLPPAWGDPTAIEQIFANLIGNALNYLDPARAGEIEVGSEKALGSSDLRTYYVKDNGLGIVREHLPKIFLAFQRLHPNAAAGEGIGLPLVRRTIERHGGRIWVESVEGQGSIFFVTLPAHPPNGLTGNDRGLTTASNQGENALWPRKQSK